MEKITLESVQKVLHLNVEYANFPTWEEILEFEVEGVQVKAIAAHKWRGDFVRIVEPFQVEGAEYRQNFCPPLIALGAAMASRTKALAARGLTVRDDCIRMAKELYSEHASCLRLQPLIDREQQAFSSVFQEELAALLKESVAAKEALRVQKLELKQKLRDKEIEPNAYQVALVKLQKNSEHCRAMYYSLELDVEYELREIRSKIIELSITDRHPERLPLPLSSSI